MKIVEYTNEYQNKYENFLTLQKNTLFFYSIKYIHFLEELLNAKNETLLVVKEEKILAILPLLSKVGIYGKVLNSLPFYGSNGFIIATDNESYSLLLNKYNDIINSKEIFSSTVISNPLLEYNNLEKTVIHNFEDYRIGQITKFNSLTSENLMNIFHSKTRNMVRKALKSNIKISIDNNSFGFLEKIHNENMDEIGGKAKSSLFFKLVQKYFISGEDYNIYIAKQNDVDIAALLVFYFNDTVEYFTPVVKVEYRNIQPLSAIIYIAMQDAIKNGYKNWNWGGTWATQDGVYRFKKRWGTEDLTYYYYTKLNYDVKKLSKIELNNSYEYFYTVPFDAIEK